MTIQIEDLQTVDVLECAWDPAGCPRCGGGEEAVDAGDEIEGLRKYSCRNCGERWEAMLKNGKPVSRILHGGEEETRGYRCGDGAESGRYRIPQTLPCGCGLRTNAGRAVRKGRRIEHPTLANGDRLCLKHRKRWKLVLAFVEAPKDNPE